MEVWDNTDLNCVVIKWPYQCGYDNTELRAHCQNRSNARKPHRCCDEAPLVCLCKKVAATYSAGFETGTIGGAGLNFSVRDGKRWAPAPWPPSGRRGRHSPMSFAFCVFCSSFLVLSTKYCVPGTLLFLAPLTPCLWSFVPLDRSGEPLRAFLSLEKDH